MLDLRLEASHDALSGRSLAIIAQEHHHRMFILRPRYQTSGGLASIFLQEVASVKEKKNLK